MTSRSTRPQRRLAALALALASSLLALSPLHADVVGIGDISPNKQNPDPPPAVLIPDLPQFGGPVPTVIVGGTGDFVGGTEAGQMTIDIPSDTDPLVSNVGAIGNTQGGQGLVRVLSLNSEWQISSGLYVAVFGQGSLQIVAGARVGPDPMESSTTQQLKIFLGYAEGSQGFATVDGFTSLLKSRTLTVGRAGAGTLTVTNGGRIETIFEAQIGGDAFTQTTGDTDVRNGIGLVTLDGQATRWNVGIPAVTSGSPTPDPLPNPNNNDAQAADLFVGKYGRGSLVIQNQAWTRVTRDILIGSQANSYGETTVTGQGSTLWSLRDLVIGNAVAGANLNINDDGFVRAEGNITVGPLGFVNLGGGTLQRTTTTGGTVVNNGVIRGDGRVDTGIAGTVTNNGYIRNAAGIANTREKLVFTGPVTNNNILESVGGEMEFQAPVPFVNNANIVGKDAIFRFNGGLNNGGNLYLKNSIVYTLNTVQNTAQALVMEGESRINGNFTTTGLLTVEVGHTSSLLSVNGAVTLGGDLLVTAVDDILGSNSGDGYFPGVGDSFEIITGNSVSGMFADIDDLFPTINFNATYLPDRVLLTAIAGPAGGFNADFNGDGIVDGDDFFTWQTNNGTMVPPGTMGDADSDGDVDETDLQIWQDQFGGPPGAVAAAGAVPEPAAAVLALAGLALPLWRRRR